MLQLQMAEWRLVLLFVPADFTCACSPAVRPPPSPYTHCNHHHHLTWRTFEFISIFCSFAPQVSADISSAVQETEAALQLLQERVLLPFFDSEDIFAKTLRKKKI